MLPPSQRSRKRPAGHLALRRPIPQLHRASSRCRVLTSGAKHSLLNTHKCVTAYKRRLSKCLLTVTHTQARRLTLSISLFWKTQETSRVAQCEKCVAQGVGKQEKCIHTVPAVSVCNARNSPINVLQICKYSCACAKVFDSSTFRTKIQ